MSSATVDCSNIHDWESFHTEFSRVLGFPNFYGKNMNAWIDCMTSIDCPEDGMTTTHAKNGVFTLSLANVKIFKSKHPKLYSAILEGSAFVNFRRIEVGQNAVLALSFSS